MKHKLKISVANESPKGGIVTCKKKKVKRGLFKRLFGIDPDKVTIIIPGDSVQDGVPAGMVEITDDDDLPYLIFSNKYRSLEPYIDSKTSFGEAPPSDINF